MERSSLLLFSFCCILGPIFVCTFLDSFAVVVVLTSHCLRAQIVDQSCTWSRMSSRIATLKRLAEQLQGSTKARADACNRLAEAYWSGNGVEKDKGEAVKWWIKASELGHAEAQYNAGVCYYHGRGVAQSYEKAFHWYQKAADQGVASAQYSLGRCYQHGMGVAKSLKKAKRFYKLAAKQGDAPAHAALAKLEAASGKDADIRKTQKHLNKARAALAAAGGSEASAQDKRIVQALYEQAKLASLFRCHNEECSVAYSEDVSVQSAKLKSCARCRKVAYCSVECQTADWKARHKDECGKRLEVGETFLLCKLVSRPELNGCRVEVVRGMDKASHRVGVRVLSEAPRAAGAAAEGEDNEERKGDEEDGSEAGSVVVGLVLSVKPKNLRKEDK